MDGSSPPNTNVNFSPANFFVATLSLGVFIMRGGLINSNRFTWGNVVHSMQPWEAPFDVQVFVAVAVHGALRSGLDEENLLRIPECKTVVDVCTADFKRENFIKGFVHETGVYKADFY